MSEIDYKTGDPTAELPRHRGIKAWGMFLVVIAWLLICGAAITGIELAAQAVKGHSTTPTQPPLLLLGNTINVLIQGWIFLRVGRGARQGRRWARSIIVAFSASFVIRGLFGLPESLVAFQYVARPHTVLTATTTRPISTGISMAFAVIVFGFMLLFFEVFPALMFWYFNRSVIQAEFEKLDPHPAWTDRCPLPVLIFCAFCVFEMLQLVRSIPLGVASIFATLLVGPPAWALMAVQFLLLLAVTMLCCRLRLFGWLLAVVITALNCISDVAFLLHGDLQTLFDLTQVRTTAERASEAHQLVRVTLTCQSVFHAMVIVYLLFLYRYFKPPLATIAAG
jgi:hypothetical protein